MSDAVDVRIDFDSRIDALKGRRVLAVDYWDVHNFGTEPANGTTATGTTPSWASS